MQIKNIHISRQGTSSSNHKGQKPLYVWSKVKRMNDSKKEMLFSELHSLLASGIDFSHAFEMLIQGEKDKTTKALLGDLFQHVVQGDMLWQALSLSGQFTALDYGVVRIGEETGKLHESLIFLSDYYHKKMAQKRMISSAVSYPVIILSVAVIVLIFMVLVIVPMFEQVYARMGGELPGITQVVIAFSRNSKTYLFFFILFTGGSASLLTLYKNTERMQKYKSAFLLKIPVAGELLKMHYQSHFCKLLYLLYSSGVPLLQGIEMLRGIITFYPYRKSFEVISKGLYNGESLAENIARFDHIYDRKLSTLLKVGEETNTLSGMLKKQGDDLSVQLEHKLKQMGNMLEPVLILFVGILVAIVLISMYLPMFKLGTTIY